MSWGSDPEGGRGRPFCVHLGSHPHFTMGPLLRLVGRPAQRGCDQGSCAAADSAMFTFLLHVRRRLV